MDATSSEPHRQSVLSHPTHTFTADELLDLTRSSRLNNKLADFGTAAAVDGFRAEIIQPYALRVPEVILGAEWGPSADIWNLGCLIFELLNGRWFLVSRGGPTWTPEASHLAHMPAMAQETFDPVYFGNA
ncbi:putative protein kinase domain containing protein [Lyophyllum shimeji]|uniref:non-specific serine/threonine protein kinase n=1 Tax=Lyophyllum shimeji TaxID=47721 RepID=A0A9P3PUL3_LYOSH|nr:putative protein kinase domain containing protein [Lyophyllum shimeji]